MVNLPMEKGMVKVFSNIAMAVLTKGSFKMIKKADKGNNITRIIFCTKDNLKMISDMAGAFFLVIKK